MFPFPSPDQSMNQALEDVEQQALEEDATDVQNRTDDTPQTDAAGDGTSQASDETPDNQ